MTSKQHQIPESKKKVIKELFELMRNKKTILIASIKNLPASQFQETSKKLRNKAIVKVLKKNLMIRAIDSSGDEDVQKLKDYLEDSVAILFSDLESFDLASELIKSKSPAKAKAGQEAPEDIEVQAGPTDLVPGPAISELGSLGIQIQIEGGKIHIKESRVIAKKGDKISQGAADVMAKLDIKPFSIGFIPLLALDVKEKKLYLEIKIDREGILKALKEAYGKSLAFAVEIGYVSDGTIKFLIGKAGIHGIALEKLIGEKIEENQGANKINEEKNDGDKNE